MYSVVLLMALSGGAEAPDLGHHKCSGGGGCSGGYVVAGCTGGGYGCTGGGGYGCTGGYVMAGCSGGNCSGSCHGGHHKLFGGGLFKKHHSCHGSSACHGGGCTGGMGYGGCTGGMGYGGCTGGMGYPGCAGGMMVTPPAGGGEKIKEMPKEKKEKKEGEVSAPATIVLSLPADAQVAIDGVVTTSTSASRTFVTPELNPAKTFVYRLSAQIVRGGETLTVTEDVAVRAGEETRVSFGADRFTAVTVAAK